MGREIVNEAAGRWPLAAATVGVAMAVASVASAIPVSTNGSSVKSIPSSGWTALATGGGCDKRDCGDGNHNQVLV